MAGREKGRRGEAYLVVALDLCDGRFVKLARVAFEIIDVEDLVDTGGVTAREAARVDAVDPGEMAGAVGAGLESHDVLLGNNLGRSLLSEGQGPCGENDPSEEGEFLAADHGEAYFLLVGLEMTSLEQLRDQLVSAVRITSSNLKAS